MWSLDADTNIWRCCYVLVRCGCVALGLWRWFNQHVFYVDVARVGGALRFGETRALTATLPPSHDLAAGTVSFWFQPEFDTATTTAVHDLFIVGPNTYSTGRVHIFNNG